MGKWLWEEGMRKWLAGLGGGFLGVAVTIGAIAFAAVALVSVTVPPEKTAAGERLLLGEMAFIEVLDPAGEALAEALGRVDLGPAPAPGRALVLRRDDLKKARLASGLDLRSATWNLPPELKVTAEADREVGEAELRAALEKYLAASEPYQSGRFELVSLSLGPPPVLDPGPVSFRFQPQASSNPLNITGFFVYSQNSRDVGRSRASAQVELSVPVLVAARALPRGRVLDGEDFIQDFLPYNQARGALSDAEQVLGATLKTAVTAGTPLRERALGRSLMVRSGDIVILMARQGNLSATTTGEAKADGALGDVITVTNMSSKKNVRGRIVGPGRVEVVF
jgi:flagella basal body P-ring formation protein FlgA